MAQTTNQAWTLFVSPPKFKVLFQLSDVHIHQLYVFPLRLNLIPSSYLIRSLLNLFKKKIRGEFFLCVFFSAKVVHIIFCNPINTIRLQNEVGFFDSFARKKYFAFWYLIISSATRRNWLLSSTKKQIDWQMRVQWEEYIRGTEGERGTERESRGKS